MAQLAVKTESPSGHRSFHLPSPKQTNHSTKPQPVIVKIRNSEDVVEIFPHTLPEDPAHVMDLLAAEIAPLETWLQVAVEYFKLGKIPQFLQVLQVASSDETNTVEQYRASKSQRIAILNSLASYATARAFRERDRRRKEDLFLEATQYFNRADRIDINEEMTWVGKAFLFFCRGNVDSANTNFDTALEANSNNIPALLGKACILYNRRDYTEALKLYRQVLRINPNVPANVRLGIALCYYQLRREDKARQGFERVLSLEPDNVEALVGLAIIELANGTSSDGVKPESIRVAFQHIAKAYKANPSHPMVLLQLANHFFYVGDYQKARQLAFAAQQNAEGVQFKVETRRDAEMYRKDGFYMRAEALFQLGRTHHAQNDMGTALQYYSQAVKLWPEHTLCQFGLGQAYIHEGKVSDAITCFEKVLTRSSDNVETLRILGSLYNTEGRRDKALQTLRRVADLLPNDPEVWIEMGIALEGTDSAEALKAYEQALHLLRQKSETVPVELWNNIAVLRQEHGDMNGSREAYRKALEKLSDKSPLWLTVSFNLGRWYEANKRMADAKAKYEDVLSHNPKYIDAYLRLHAMARNRGDLKKAKEILSNALTQVPNCIDAISLMGTLHIDKEEWANAAKRFDQIIKEKDKHDAYSMVSMGNVFYSWALDESEKEDRYLERAMEFFWKVLSLEESNAYASNGLGMVLAEKGKTAKAKEVFELVLESMPNMPDVLVNLGHVYLAMKQHTNAIKMYEKALKRFYNNRDSLLLQYLARAHFEAGQLDECKSILLKAIHYEPGNAVLRYDLAVTQETSAVNAVKKERKTVGELRAAVKDLKLAEEGFAMILMLKQFPKQLDAARTKTHQQYCELSHKTALDHLLVEEQNEAIRQDRREAVKRELELLEAKKREEQQRKAEEKRKEEERLQRLEAEKQAKLQELQSQWQALDQAEKAKEKTKEGSKRGKKKTKAEETSESDQSDSEVSAKHSDSENEKRAASDGEKERAGSDAESEKKKRKRERKEKKERKRKRREEKKKRKKRADSESNSQQTQEDREGKEDEQDDDTTGNNNKQQQNEENDSDGDKKQKKKRRLRRNREDEDEEGSDKDDVKPESDSESTQQPSSAQDNDVESKDQIGSDAEESNKKKRKKVALEDDNDNDNDNGSAQRSSQDDVVDSNVGSVEEAESMKTDTQTSKEDEEGSGEPEAKRLKLNEEESSQ
eukprot:GILK01005923.1.p1 GENE.GILK01005923.1~~GILK01005923.1.p1  ORF type:complete len:1224 (-),score=347.14 GILK01005923.1:129-3746(-)